MARHRRRIGLGLVVALLVWVGVVAASTWSVRDELRGVEATLRRAEQRLAERDTDAAASELGTAADTLDSARAVLHRPDVALASRLPWAGRSLRTASAVVDAAAEVTEATLPVLGGLDLEDLLPGRGRIPVERLADLGPQIRAIHAGVRSAAERVHRSPATLVVGEVRDARARLLGLLVETERTAGTAADVLEVLPGLLGADGPRRYLLGAANLAELRGSGGLIGSVAVLEVSDGRIAVGTFSPSHLRPTVPAQDLPAPDPSYAARYDRFGGAGNWLNLNMTPDLPSAARALETLWTHTTGTPVDGTIIVDVWALRALLELSGPVTGPEGLVLTADDVVAYVSNRAYVAERDPVQRQSLLGELAAAALSRALDGGLRSDALAVLGGLVRRRHLVIHARDPAVQRILVAAGVDGGLRAPPGDFSHVALNNAAANKLDYYLDREVTERVELLSDGAARHTIRVELHNRAPGEGLIPYIGGPNVEGLHAGENRTLASVYAAAGATPTEVRWDRSGTPPGRVEEELGLPVVSVWLDTPSQTSRWFEVTWLVPDAWTAVDGELVYRLTHRYQPAIRPAAVEVVVGVPDGFRVVDADGGHVLDRQVRWRWPDLQADTAVALRLAPVDGERTVVVP